MTIRTLFYLVAAGLLSLGARAADPVTVSAAWVRATPPGATTAAAYLEIANPGAPDALLRAASPVAARAELHGTTEHDGMLHMSSVTAIPLPTGATVTLAPGGLHVMLIDIRAPLKAGEQVPLMLEFASGARLTIEATVRDARAAAAAGH